METDRYSRQNFLVNRDALTEPILIVGAGAIGSFTTIILSKLGYLGQITVVDNDTVEEHNLPNQFYKNSDLSKHKVVALTDLCRQMSHNTPIAIPGRLESVPDGITTLILAVDNMESRIALFKSFYEQPTKKYLFDTRMGGDDMRIYSIDMNNTEHVSLFQDTLYTDQEASQAACTNQSLIYNVSVVSGLLVNQIKKVLMGQEYSPEIIFNLKMLQLIKA